MSPVDAVGAVGVPVKAGLSTAAGSALACYLPNLAFTGNPQDLAACTFIIVAVPTPVNVAKEPDLEPLEKSSAAVGAILRKGMMVCYESTVYPGVTEDYCLPILEKKSGLKLGQFDLGYSPERVNPGDKKHTVTTVVKVVSGHNPKALKRCAAVSYDTE